ncbi:unnamed protein product [Hymenolepis diminuta]|uniref:Parvo_NS1 domain-containing protein n=1 Tax=Hymenolepis diminuta TaxID=6216 RepID=A0A0R3SKT2_HYMDI|nr:unnamed protein product [Hymenolepis diminuta]
MLAPPDVIGECSNPTAIRRLSIREESAIRTKNKFDKEKSLFDLFTSLNVKSEEEFNGWLKMDPSQLPEIWAKYGQNWRVKLREYIEICVKTKRGRFDKPFYEIPYLERVIQSDCTDELHDPHPNDGAFYISEIFKQNDIDVRKFLDDVNSIICMNALVLRGPTTTGKSLIAKNIVKPYNYGTVSRDGDATAFYLQNLLDHEVALMEEPRISMATVQNFKELLAGSKLLVQVKNRGPRDLPRIPCIITTNRALWDDLTDAEISGYSGRLYIDSSKLPEFRPFLDKYYLKEEDWDKAISAIVADFHNRGIYFSGRYDEKAKEYELQYQAQQALIKQSMSKNNNKDVDPPVLLSSLPKKLKLAGQAASAVAAMANMLPGPDHEVALMEEPHISMATVQNFKELFAGSKLLVQVKNKGPRDLPRIPCIITTNRALWDDLTDAEAEPIKRRIIEYLLFKPIRSDYKPIICFHSWRSLCQLLINK